MTDTYKNYLFDLGFLLKERAVEAKRRRIEARGTDAEAFESGRQMAFYEVIDLMQHQADAFQIPLSDMRLDGIDPDKDMM